ncbi:hypothetical protein [Aminobacter sp. HY435]|uniref:hypothetical protein n=1 Tax=Aminobacter sp. HY435 TaxID=2970917 RepID=UPI0022B9A20C|nr:hypothetical protein [Aminobacter sp. HY435]
MADTDGTKPSVDPSRLELSVGGGGADSLDAVRGGGNKVKSTEDGGQGIDFETDGSITATGLDKVKPKEENSEETTEEDNEGGDKPSETEATEGDNSDLGEWDPENTEVGAKFDERYFKEGSELNMDAFTTEVAANAAKEGGTPVLNEATYGWLKDRMGVSKTYADSIIKGQLALRQQNEDAFYTRVGGKEVYTQKQVWAKENYTPEQKARFNAAIKAGGSEAEEALELLNTRWEKAGNKAPEAKREEVRKGLPTKRPASPAKTTQAAQNPGGTGNVKPFANGDEHRAALKEAQRAAPGDRVAQLDLVRKRLAASTFWK